jgi:HK97 family phage portal protein
MSMRSLLGGIVNNSPVPLVSSRAGGGFTLGTLLGGTGRDRTSQLQAMSATPTLYGVIRKLARVTAAPEWHLCRKPANPGDDPVPLTGARAENAAPLKVWNKPNAAPHMTRTYFTQGIQQHKDLVGEFWWVVNRFAGIPVEIWPVRPDRIFPVPSETKLVAGYIYRAPTGEEVPLELDEVICSIDPSPTDPLRGEGPIGALASDLTQSDAQAEWQASFYRNSANPGGIIKVGRKLNDREWEELVERWRFEHQGSSNAGRVAVLEEGDFTPLSYAQKDMQFVESRGLTRQAIFDAYGFPKFGIGDVDDVNRASADASLALIAQTLAVPRLNDIRDVLNNRFLPMFGPMWRNYTFEYDSPVPPDAESERLDLTARANAFATLINVRVEPDDAAEVCGLPPMRVKEPEPVPAPAPGRGVPGAPAGDPDEDPQKDPEQEKE